MHDFRIETRIGTDGSITILGLPFRPGDKVEVTIRGNGPERGNGDRYPLRGQPIRYTDPFRPVADDDWDARK